MTRGIFVGLSTIDLIQTNDEFPSANTKAVARSQEILVAGTSGAGDIFHGAFCSYTATGSSFVDSLRQAAVIATESCRFRGTRKWMTTR